MVEVLFIRKRDSAPTPLSDMRRGLEFVKTIFIFCSFLVKGLVFVWTTKSCLYVNSGGEIDRGFCWRGRLRCFISSGKGASACCQQCVEKRRLIKPSITSDLIRLRNAMRYSLFCNSLDCRIKHVFNNSKKMNFLQSVYLCFCRSSVLFISTS